MVRASLEVEAANFHGRDVGLIVAKPAVKVIEQGRPETSAVLDVAFASQNWPFASEWK